MVKRRLEFRDGTKARFCEIALEGAGFSVLEGDIEGDIDGAGDPVSETHRHDSEVEAAAALDELIDERREQGWVVRFDGDPEIDRYFAEDFVAEVIGDSSRRAHPADNRERLESLHATTFPHQLRAFLEMKDAYQLGYNNLGEWRIWGADSWAPDPDDGNLFEQVVRLDQQNYLGTAMLEYGAAMVYIGSAGNGDCYFAALDHRHPENTAVLFWDHETQDLTHTIADSLGTLAYANHLLARVQGSDDLDSEALATDAARLLDRCALSWHYRGLCEAAGIDPGHASDAPTRFYFYRALPFAYLLNNHHKLDTVENLWDIIPHENLDFEQTVGGPFLAKTPATAFYWLWRLFFFAVDDQLRQVIALCKDSPSPLIRDMATLVEELQDGRVELGSIGDIHELRRRFIELDLDPDRAAEREREAAEAVRAAELQAAADAERVAEWIATRTHAELVELAWAHAGNQVLIDGLYDHLATTAELESSVRRWRFIADQGASRDGKFFSEEVDETWEALAATAPAAVIPMLLTRAGHRGLPVAAKIAVRTGEARESLTAAVRDHLEARDEFCHRNTAGVRAGAILGAGGYTGDFLAMLDRFAYDWSDAIAEIEKKDVNVALIRALGQTSSPEAAARLMEIATGDNPKLVAPALSALGALGDGSATELLIGCLDGAHSRLALYALARLTDRSAREAARDAVGAHIERIAGLPELLVYPRLMAEALEPDPDLGVARLALEVIPHNHYEQTEQLSIAIELLDRHGDESDVARLRGFVDAEHQEVREAAVAALERRGEPVEPHYWDRGTVDALYDSGGVDALVTALNDPASVNRHNLVRKAVDVDACADIADAAGAYIRDAARFEHYTYQYVHSDGKWKRMSSGAAAAAQCSPELARWLLTHPNIMVRDVFRYGFDAVKDGAAKVGSMKTRRPTRATPAHPVELEGRRLGDQRWAGGAMINGLAFTPDGSLLAVVGAGVSRLLDAASGRLIRELEAISGKWVYDIDIHPGGELAAAGANGARLHLLNLSDGKPVATLHGHTGGVRKVRFSPSGERIASAGDDQRLVFWRVGEADPVSRIEEPFDVNAVDWIDEDTVVFGTDKHIGIARFGATEVERRSDISTADVRVFAGGTQIAAGGSSGRSIAIFDRELDEIAKHRQENVARIRFSADESVMFAASWSGGDTGVWRWDLGSRERELVGHDSADVFGLALCRATGVVAAGGKLNRVVRFAADGAALDEPRVGHDGEVQAIGATDSHIFTGAGGGLISWPRGDAGAATMLSLETGFDAVAIAGPTAYLAGGRAIDIATGETRWEVELQRSEVVAVAGDAVFGSGGDLVWVAVDSGEVRATETISDKTWIEHLVALGGGRAAVAGYREHCLDIWDLVERRRLHRVSLPPSDDKPDTCHYAFSRSTGCIYVSRWDRSIVEVDAATATVRRTIQLHLPLYPIAASPVSPILAVAAGNRVLALDLERCEIAGEIEVAGASVEAMAFVGDRELVCGATGGEVSLVTLHRRDSGVERG